MDWNLLQSFAGNPLLLWCVPVFTIAVLVDVYLSARRSEEAYGALDTWQSAQLLLIAGAAELIPLQLAIVAMVALHELSPLADMVQRQWWAWVVLLLLSEFSYYWFHRLHHSVRLLWAGHANHHSSRYMNFTTALRAGVGEQFLKMAFWLWLPLLGFDPGMIVAVMTFNLFYQFWLHTERYDAPGGWFSYIFNTPSHHRVHHALNDVYVDRNHGGVLILWDRLFGTFQPELEHEPCVYGLAGKANGSAPSGGRRLVLHEYAAIWSELKRTRGWGSKMRCLLRQPT